MVRNPLTALPRPGPGANTHVGDRARGRPSRGAAVLWAIMLTIGLALPGAQVAPVANAKDPTKVEPRVLPGPKVTPGKPGKINPYATTLSAEASLATIPIPIEDISPSNSDLDASDPNGASGGRVNNLASVAGDNQMFYAASEWGGLYKSTDGGDHWSFLSGHLPMVTFDVEVDPGNTGNVYATSFYDGRINSVSGIQVSHDAGVTWTHPPTATPPLAYNCAQVRKDELTAFGIAVQPDATQTVVVGTNCGVAISTNAGNTWTFVDPTPATAASDVWDVSVQAGGIIDICGDDRHRRSVDGGVNWTGGSAGLPTGQCSIAASPDESYVLLATAGGNIYESDDAGATWSAPITNPSPQGRVPFVTTNQRTTGFSLWFGDVNVYRADCTTPAVPAPGGTARCPASASWAGPFSKSAGSHADLGDVVFDSQVATDACPRLVSNDGGIYRNTDLGADCQNPNWEQPTVSPHALWLFGMDGANQAGTSAEDLYFGLQDAGSWATTTAGAATPTWSNKDCCDIFDVVADSNRVVYTMCCFTPAPGTRMFVRNAGMVGGGQVNTAPPGGLLGFRPIDATVRTADKKYAVVTTTGVYFTADITASPTVWTQLGAATSPASACGIQAAVSGGTPTFYVQAGICNERSMANSGDQLWKYSGTNPGGTWTRIDNTDGISGGFGIFAVHRGDPNRIYASNMAPGGAQMIFSNDGGLNWNPDPELDSFMTGNGVFRYQTQRGAGNFANSGQGFVGYPQPTLLAFDPDSSNVLVAGGRDSGVFLSTNGGGSWGLLTDPFTSNVSGIPHIPRPWFAYFDHEPAGSVKIFIGTQGRGVWRLSPPSADVSVTKTDSPDPVIAGQQLYYTITATNNGPDDAVNVQIVDTLPPEVDYVTDDLGACAEAPPGTLTCDLGDIPNGQSRTIVIKVAVDPSAVADHGGPFGMTNTVTVSTSGSIDPDESNNTAQASTIVEDSADLAVTKICKPDGLLPAGQTGTCTIFVDNLGPSDARGVVLVDVLAASGSFTILGTTTTQGTCVVVNQTVTCTIGVLVAGGRVIITVDVMANEATDINDVATVSATTPDPDTSNNRATGSIRVSAVANVGITKSDSPDPLNNGTTLTYTLTITNSGPSTARNVIATDNLPAGVSILSVTSTGGTCNAGVPGDPFLPTRCTFDSIAPAGSDTMTIVVRVDPGRLNLAHNDARVSADTFDPDNSNNFATTDTTIAVNDLQIVKSSDFDVYKPSATVQYQITVTNHGPADATNVVVTDNLPAVKQAVYLLDTAACTKAGLVLTCNLGTIEGASSKTFSVYVRIKGSKGVVINNATVTSSVFDWKLSNNSSTRSVLIKGGV
jgi:uncharacterized repeat protein (TIGR01451 family)